MNGWLEEEERFWDFNINFKFKNMEKKKIQKVAMIIGLVIIGIVVVMFALDLMGVLELLPKK